MNPLEFHSEHDIPRRACFRYRQGGTIELSVTKEPQSAAIGRKLHRVWSTTDQQLSHIASYIFAIFHWTDRNRLLSSSNNHSRQKLAMFDEYREALNPESTLKIVPESLLRPLLEGFSANGKCGTALLYNKQQETNTQELERLDLSTEYYHPFCRKFREDRAAENACRNCDLARARTAFKGTEQNLEHSPCHIGLRDYSFPIMINNQVRAVLFSGQKVVYERQSLEQIEKQVRLFGARYSWPEDKIKLLISLAISKGTSEQDLRTFTASFESFATSLQKLVSSLHDARQQIAHNGAQVEMNRILHSRFSNRPDWWIGPACEILDVLSGFSNNSIMMLLAQQGSFFEVKATSISVDETLIRARFPVSGFLSVPLEQFVECDFHKINDLLTDMPLSKLLNGTVFRMHFGEEEVTRFHGLLVMGSYPPSETQRLIRAFCFAIGFQAHVAQLIDQLQRQQKQFVESTAFFAHSMKVPIQNAFFALDDVLDAESAMERLAAVDRAEEQLLTSLFDAEVLQTVRMQQSEFIDLKSLFEELFRSFACYAREREVGLVLDYEPSVPRQILAVSSELRVAFSNLLDNAIKYSSPLYEVNVIAELLTSGLQVTISNYGERLPTLTRVAPASQSINTTLGLQVHRSGIGFPYALQLLEKNGWIIATAVSTPASENTESGNLHLNSIAFLKPS